MPLETESNIRLTDRKREDIIRAAVREFQRTGYFSTSMNRIAEVAQVSKRTVYNHFETKDLLFDAILQQLIDQIEQQPLPQFQSDRDLYSQLAAIARDEIEITTSPEVLALARVVLSRFMLEPELGKQTNHRRFLRRIEYWLERATEFGALKIDDIEFAAFQFIGLLRTFAFWPIVICDEPIPGPEETERIIDSTVKMFLSTYQETRSS